MTLDSRSEEQIALLVDSCNRAILTALDESDGSLHVTELGERLVLGDAAVIDDTAYENRLDEALLALHHERLPKLAEVGLIEYDPETNIVTGPKSAVEWESEGVLDALEAYLPRSDDSDEASIGTVEERESVVQFGRRLADEADEELFCMYVSTDLLEAGCVRRAEAAIDRGVRMYLGSNDDDVREIARRKLPDATVWEPQLDLLNAPTYPRVGRLVLADRERVMLGVLDEPDADGDRPEERALVGAGEDDPLVTLVRELLGSRLDHLDFQSDDFRTVCNSYR